MTVDEQSITASIRDAALSSWPAGIMAIMPGNTIDPPLDGKWGDLNVNFLSAEDLTITGQRRLRGAVVARVFYPAGIGVDSLLTDCRTIANIFDDQTIGGAEFDHAVVRSTQIPTAKQIEIPFRVDG